jgi:hypothetical protein
MNQPEPSDPLDALLLNHDKPIEDGGFTARVMATLPRRRPVSWRSIFLLGVTAVGSVLAVCWLPWGNLLVPDPSTLLSPNSPVLLTGLEVVLVVGSLTWCAISAIEWELEI